MFNLFHYLFVEPTLMHEKAHSEVYGLQLWTLFNSKHDFRLAGARIC